MAKPRSLDTLFGRLMLAQGLLALLVVALAWMLVTSERNVELAPRHAEQWAPRILTALAVPDVKAHHDLDAGRRVVVQADRPGGLALPTHWAPFWRALQPELERRGVQAAQPHLAWHDGQFVLWCQVAETGAAGGATAQPARWVRVPAADGLPPAATRMVRTVVLILLAITVLNLYYVRRITGPIERLRLHMHTQTLTGQTGNAAPSPEVPAKAPVEIRDIYADYARLLAQLQVQERERALLLAGVSHDLRSPLGRIRLAAEMLPEVADNAAGVGSITRNVEHADRLVGSFLDFVRAGALPMDEVPDLSAVLRQAVDRFGRPPTELCLLAPDSLLLAQANALLIDRLVFNLVDNALKHGKLPVTVRLSLRPGSVVLDVVDQGRGLAAAGGDALLRAFARGDTSRQVPGSGLGLAVVQQIAGRLQGRLEHFHDAGGHTMRIVLRQRSRAPAG